MTVRKIIVKADTNDADYITEESIIESDGELARLKHILEVIKVNGSRWETSEYGDSKPEEFYADLLSEDDIEWFKGFVPYGEHGVHTIESVKLYVIIQEVRLL